MEFFLQIVLILACLFYGARLTNGVSTALLLQVEPVYSLLKRGYELLDAGMAPGRVARWYEMHLADELGVRPEVDRCVECDRALEVDGRFRWVPPLGGVLCDRPQTLAWRGFRAYARCALGSRSMTGIGARVRMPHHVRLFMNKRR